MNRFLAIAYLILAVLYSCVATREPDWEMWFYAGISAGWVAMGIALAWLDTWAQS